VPIAEVPRDDLEHLKIMRTFLHDPELYIRHLR
jgi:hypothetical protein